MLMKLFLSLWVSIVLFTASMGQDQPVYNQFYFNPYLYNPAFLGDNGRLEANLTYKTQWAENPDAPTVSAFNLQYATNGNIFLGLSVQSQSAVALVTNTAYLTFGYQIKLSNVNYLKFGLSGGLLQNKLDLDEISSSTDPSILNDPVLLGAVDNTLYMTSQVGVQLRLNRLTMGFALPKLLDNDANSQDDFNSPAFNEFDQFITSVAYDFSLSPTVNLQPLLLYRHVNSQQYQAEGSVIARYKDLIWVGGGYRYDAGVIGHAGLNVKDMLSFAYSYSPGLDELQSFGGNHEITLKLKLNKREKREERHSQEVSDLYEDTSEKDSLEIAVQEDQDIIADEATEELTNEDEVVDKISQEEPEENVEDVESDPQNNLPSLVGEEPKITRVAVEESGLKPGHYVVVGVFSIRSNALSLKESILETYGGAEVALNEQNNMHYVYIYTSEDLDLARARVREIRQLSIFDFEEAWILHVE